MFNDGDGFAVGDVDADGHADILVAHNFILVFDQFGTLTHNLGRYFSSGNGFAVGDIDGDDDGRAEVLVAKQNLHIIKLFKLYPGVPGITRISDLPTSFKEDDGFAVGDVDGDGREEVLVAHRDSHKIEIRDYIDGRRKDFPASFGGRNAFAVEHSRHTTLCGDVVVPADSDANAPRILVETRTDTEPGTAQACPGLTCSLRAAIETASNLAAPNVVIDVPPGSYRLTKGTLKITGGPKNLTINGAGSDLTKIDGGATIERDPPCHTKNATGGSLVFELSQAVTMHLSGVTIEKGNGTQITIGGGGIRIKSGSGLFLSNSVVRANWATGLGAGIANYGFLRIFNCTIDKNTIRQFFDLPTGAGVFTSAGGIFNHKDAIAQIYGSTISNNRANRGGGILNEGCLEITNSTISGNMANGGGGGIRNEGTLRQPEPGQVSILFSTITNNVAALNGENEAGGNARRTGGGILNLGLLYMGDSILAANRQGAIGRDPPVDLYSPDCYSSSTDKETRPKETTFTSRGTFTSLGKNLLGVINQNCNLQDSFTGEMETVDRPFSDKLGPPPPEAPLDPKFDFVDCSDKNEKDSCCQNSVRECRDEHSSPLKKPVLKENGGPTQTIKLLNGSPAFNFADIRALRIDQRTDQRGAIRPAGEAADAGAFEVSNLPQEITDVKIAENGFSHNNAYTEVIKQVTLQNPTQITGQLFLVLEGLSTLAPPFLVNKDAVSRNVQPTGSPYLTIDIGSDHVLNSGEPPPMVTLRFYDPQNKRPPYTSRVLAGEGVP